MIPALGLRRPGAGLKRVARKAERAGPASCGGDFRSPRKAAGAAPFGRGLPLKARIPPPKKKSMMMSAGTMHVAMIQLFFRG